MHISERLQIHNYFILNHPKIFLPHYVLRQLKKTSPFTGIKQCLISDNYRPLPLLSPGMINMRDTIKI